MSFKLKMTILAAVLLFGVTGVAFASGSLPGAVSDGVASLTGSGADGASVGSASGDQYGASDEDLNDAANHEYGADGATEIEDHNSAADDEYNDDAGEIKDHDRANGNNGEGLEHENEHGNVPATTPVQGGNAPSHEVENDSHLSVQGGAGNTYRNDEGQEQGQTSGSASGTGARHLSSTPPMGDKD
ncbi:MAG: hypothetical protein ACYC6Z_01270 [Thermoleophilia bacterium]